MIILAFTKAGIVAFCWIQAHIIFKAPVSPNFSMAWLPKKHKGNFFLGLW